MKKAIFLFDVTGLMALPWAKAGYQCYCFDGQHPKGVSISSLHPNILNAGMWFSCDVTGDASSLDLEKITSITGEDICFIFGFPECTHLAVSGAAHFARKRDDNPFFQDEAMVLVKLTQYLGGVIGCPWALENPVSVISSMWRKPDYKFHPYEYGGYLPVVDVHPNYPEYIKPRDAYPKKTCIWSGNGFVMPEKKPVEVDNGYSDQHKKLGGKSLKTKNIRSATPRGFAQAVFEANNQH
ncbi:MAG: putative DNA (cytosine-5)-methyltransferase [Prokaryotic dsDNA virus sp.]|nr:MAG: putative DNA (cytosine-5)-methyltransferase [Prokaryotic dsDNA virus sp.]|tara:strand:- start:33899 stop:34615 length:717 start_codon:yes stop_codon:yes gene_type:complete